MILSAQIKAGIAAAVVAVAALAAWTWQGDRQENKASQLVIGQQKAAIQTQTIYRVTDAQRQEIIDEVRTQYSAELAQSASSAFAAHGDADRLRKLLARRAGAIAPAASAASGVDEAGAYRTVLDSCVQEYQRLGEDADRAADQVEPLQNYAKRMAANQKELVLRLQERQVPQ